MATNNKESKSQLEVWDWKEKAFLQIKDMPLNKAVEWIIEQTKSLEQHIANNKRLRK